MPDITTFNKADQLLAGAPEPDREQEAERILAQQQPGTLQRFGRGFLQGLVNVPLRAGEAIQRAQQPLLQQLQQISPMAARVAAPTVPVRSITVPGATGIAGLAGRFAGAIPPLAAGGAILGAAGTPGIAADALLGASQAPDHPLLGASIGGAGGVIASQGSKLISEIASLRRLAKPSKFVAGDQAVLDEAARRADIAREIGVPNLTAGALTGKGPIQAKEELLLKGAGNEAAAKFQVAADNINKNINQAAENISKELGGDEKTALVMGSDINDILRQTRQAARKKISNIYNSAAEATGSDVPVPSQEIIDTASDAKDSIVGFEFPPIVKRPLDELEAGKELNVGDANKLVIALNTAIRANKGEAAAPLRLGLSRVLDKTHEALDSLGDNSDVASRDLFIKARKARKALGDVFDQGDIVNTIVSNRGSVTGRIAPEKIVEKIFGKTNNITNVNKIENALKFRLDEEGNKIPNPEGEKIWNDLKTTQLNKIIENARDPATRNLSYRNLIRGIKNMGPEVWDKIIDNKNVSDKFNKLISVMDFWQNKAPGVINYSNTANVIARFANSLGDSMFGLTKLPFVGKIFSGLSEIAEKAKDTKWVEDNLRFQDNLKTLRQQASKQKGRITGPLGKTLTKGARLGLLATIANELGGPQ